MVLLPKFDPGEWLDLVERHRVTQTFVVPTMLRRILDHPRFGTTDLSSLRALSYGAAACPVDLVRRAVAAFPDVDFSNTFGQTETLGAYAALTPEDHRRGDRFDSVGRPLAGVELRIVEPGTDHEVEPGCGGRVRGAGRPEHHHRVAAHRRHRPPGRRGLPLPGGPALRHHQPRRGEVRTRRGGGGPPQPPAAWSTPEWWASPTPIWASG